MKKENIETLVNFMKENDLSKISYSDGDLSICLEKSAAVDSEKLASFIQNSAVASPNKPSSAPLSSQGQETQQENPCSFEKVLSPLVGTFYTSPSPDKPAFVKIGDKVEAGQTLCIIEAMKILNPVHASKSGTIKKICCENESPVEFNQELFEIEPHK